MSLLFNMLSRFVIAFLPRIKCLLMSWLQSLPTVILEPKKIKSVTVSTFSPSICHKVMGPDAMIIVLGCWVLSQLFHSPLSSRGSLFFFTFCHKGGVIWISELIDISPSNLDSSLWFIQPDISHDVLCISTSALLTMPKPLTVWITTNCGKFLKRWEYQTTWLASWDICMQVKKQQLELDMEQQTGSKWGKEYIKAVYCHPAYLTYMQSTSCKILGWMKLKLESRLPGEISITSDMQMTPPLWQKVKKN